MSERAEFKVDDLVIWSDRSSRWTRAEYWGRVTHVTEKGTVTVEGLAPPHHERTFRRGKYGHECRLASDEEKRHRLWMLARPRTEVVDCAFAFASDRDVRVQLDLETWDTHSSEKRDELPEKIRQARRELKEILTWWEERP